MHLVCRFRSKFFSLPVVANVVDIFVIHPIKDRLKTLKCTRLLALLPEQPTLKYLNRERAEITAEKEIGVEKKG